MLTPYLFHNPRFFSPSDLACRLLYKQINIYAEEQMKIIISDKGKAEIKRLGINIKASIEKLLKHVPDADLLQLSHILVTDIPENKNSREEGALGAYFCKWNNRPARIELYIKNIFEKVNPKALKIMFPVIEIDFANVLYHEIGHHVEKVRAHGIGKSKRESYADEYANKLSCYVTLQNTESMQETFQFLEENRERLKLGSEMIANLKNEWEKLLEKTKAQNKIAVKTTV